MSKLIPKHQTPSQPLVLSQDNTRVERPYIESVPITETNLYKQYLADPYRNSDFNAWKQRQELIQSNRKDEKVKADNRSIKVKKQETKQGEAIHSQQQRKELESKVNKGIWTGIGLGGLAVAQVTPVAPYIDAVFAANGLYGLAKQADEGTLGLNLETGLNTLQILPGAIKVGKPAIHYTTNYVNSRIPYFGNNLVSRTVNTVRHKFGTPQQPELLRKIIVTPQVDDAGNIILSGNRFDDVSQMHAGITNFTTDRPVTPHSKHKNLDMYELFVVNPNKVNNSSYVSIDPSDTFIKTDRPLTVAPKDVTVITGNPEFISWAKQNKIPYYTNNKLQKLHKEALAPRGPYVKDRDSYKNYSQALEDAYRSRTIPTYQDYQLLSERTGLPLRVIPYSDDVANANPYGWRDRGTWRNVYYDSSTPVESAYRTWIKNNLNSSKHDFWDWYQNKRPYGRKNVYNPSTNTKANITTSESVYNINDDYLKGLQKQNRIKFVENPIDIDGVVPGGTVIAEIKPPKLHEELSEDIINRLATMNYPVYDYSTWMHKGSRVVGIPAKHIINNGKKGAALYTTNTNNSLAGKYLLTSDEAFIKLNNDPSLHHQNRFIHERVMHGTDNVVEGVSNGAVPKMYQDFINKLGTVQGDAKHWYELRATLGEFNSVLYKRLAKAKSIQPSDFKIKNIRKDFQTNIDNASLEEITQLLEDINLYGRQYADLLKKNPSLLPELKKLMKYAPVFGGAVYTTNSMQKNYAKEIN